MSGIWHTSGTNVSGQQHDAVRFCPSDQQGEFPLAWFDGLSNAGWAVVCGHIIGSSGGLDAASVAGAAIVCN